MHPTAIADHPALQGLPHGWFNHGPLLVPLVEAERPQRCVELGTWLGASAIAFARLLAGWNGVLTCVDTWHGVVNGGTQPGRYPQMLADCAGHLVAAGVSSRVRLIPALTGEAAAAWQDGLIDFLYIDADHTEASVTADLEAWWPHLRPGGLIAGDDYHNAMYLGTTVAWDNFEQRHRQRFERVPNPALAGMSLIYGYKDARA